MHSQYGVWTHLVETCRHRAVALLGNHVHARDENEHEDADENEDEDDDDHPVARALA